MDIIDARAVLDLLGSIVATFDRRAADPRFGDAHYQLAMGHAAGTVRSELANADLDLAAYLDIDPAELAGALTSAATRAQATHEKYSRALLERHDEGTSYCTSSPEHGDELHPHHA